MTELTKEDVKDAVREAMAEKIERTFGVDCSDVDERSETRKDMEFLRALRVGTLRGSERVFWWIIAAIGTSALTWFWPDISKHIGK